MTNHLLLTTNFPQFCFFLKIKKHLISNDLCQAKYRPLPFCGRQSFFLQLSKMLIFPLLKILLKIDSGCQKSCERRIWKIEVYLIGMSLLSLYLCCGSCSKRSFCSWEWHGYWDAAAQNHVTRFCQVFARRRLEAKMRDSDRKTRNNSQEMLVLRRVEYLCSSAKGFIILSWLHRRYCRSQTFWVFFLS